MTCGLVGIKIFGIPIIKEGYCSTPSTEFVVLIMSIVTTITIILLYLKIKKKKRQKNDV